MDSKPELIQIRDEVFRKIGRNLLNFQKIELMLKHLIKNSRLSGPMSQLKEIKERQAETVHKQTLGNLVGRFVENTFSEQGHTYEPTTDLKEPHFSFSFTVEADADFYEERKRELKSLVDDRNDLIHHLLPRFDTESIESCLEIEKYLDAQRERLIPEYDYLKSLIDELKSHADFINSEEGKKQVQAEMALSFLQQNPVVQLLVNVSIQHARPDGWASMAVAGQQIHRIFPDKLEKLKTGWGYKSLRELMEASEFFDFYHEPTEKGGARLLYRSKPELAFASFSRLINSLQDTFSQSARAGGWALLSAAQQQIEQLFADDFALVKAKYGLCSLKELILESESFEVIEESNDTGDVYDIYRPKAE